MSNQLICYEHTPNVVFSIDPDNLEFSFKQYLTGLSNFVNNNDAYYPIKNIDNAGIYEDYPAKTNDNNTVFIPIGEQGDEGLFSMLMATQNLELISQLNNQHFNRIGTYHKIDNSKPAFFHTATRSEWGGEEGYSFHKLYIIE